MGRRKNKEKPIITNNIVPVALTIMLEKCDEIIDWISINIPDLNVKQLNQLSEMKSTKKREEKDGSQRKITDF